MNSGPRVFADSDVVISSLLSELGAAHLLLNRTNIDCFISNVSLSELRVVVKRLGIENEKLTNLVNARLKAIKLDESLDEIKKRHKKYTHDENDAHIVAGSYAAKAKFLITYNMRDFKVDDIKRDFGIICMRPAQFLQYLRSLS